MQNDTLELTPEKVTGPYVIASAYRTLELLRVFSVPPHRYSLAELVAARALDKGQVYRSLKTLEEAGFLRFGEDGRFSLTPLLSVLGIASLGTEQASLAEVASPILTRLALETGETVHLFARVADRAVCIEIRESPQPIRLSAALGASAPLHAGASPKAILAYLPAAERAEILAGLEAYPKYTDRTLVDVEGLEAELAQTVARGYAVSDEDVDREARGVGAAIFDLSGRVVGAVSVGGPAYRVDAAQLETFGRLIVQGAQTISRGLGHTA